LFLLNTLSLKFSPLISNRMSASDMGDVIGDVIEYSQFARSGTAVRVRQFPEGGSAVHLYSGEHLQTGKAFKRFGELRSREFTVPGHSYGSAGLRALTTKHG
jgi:hypothetical protein